MNSTKHMCKYCHIITMLGVTGQGSYGYKHTTSFVCNIQELYEWVSDS